MLFCITNYSIIKKLTYKFLDMFYKNSKPVANSIKITSHNIKLTEIIDLESFIDEEYLY